MINYPHLAAMVFNTPLLCTNELKNSVVSFLAPKLLNNQIQEGAELGGLSILMDQLKSQDVNKRDDIERVGLIISNGIAIIPVHGILATRRGMITRTCEELTSYEYLSSQLSAAVNDESIHEIIFDIDTGGGSATGAFEFAEEVYEARQLKKITAIVNFSAYSAGYLIAAACSQIIVSKTSGVGSIGVIAEAAEFSKWEEETGIKYTTVFKGDHKNDLSPHEPITEQSLAMLDELCEESYQLFINAVSRYRNMDLQSVIDTQAGVFRGQKAITAGLADSLETPRQATNRIGQAAVERQQSANAKQATINRRAEAINMQSQL